MPHYWLTCFSIPMKMSFWINSLEKAKESLLESSIYHTVTSMTLSLLTLGAPNVDRSRQRKQASFSKGDSSRQAPTTHLCHTFSGLAQASHALPASFWYQWFRTNRATILESGVVIHFEFFELQPFKVDQIFRGFFWDFQTLITL